MPDYSNIIDSSLVSLISEYLDAHPAGVMEHDLLRHLDKQEAFKDLDSSESSTLVLFRKHFLIFHVLHSLNNDLVSTKQGAISISPLSIKKLDHVEADTQVGEFDPLSRYYLDMSHLESATSENINSLLDVFWEKYLRNEKRGDALKVLGLDDPVSDKEIVKRYRKLASTHHPDKGGDNEKIQSINEAYAVLIRP